MTGPTVYRDVSRVLKALSSESRLLIIDRLGRGEATVSELRDLVGSDQSTVSKHLALLRAVGLVEDRRRGASVLYRLPDLGVLNVVRSAHQLRAARR